ncbi:ABC transporter ATP-binding protein [Actinomadura sp. NBRC 104412]|uniref:ABC transporter ATP-binding protein n=1 Tax=Actinomadura sp. NBRC 104412 TaxID=3032203 RepID=UPI0024A3686F|nr:ABC transporter ATP-binding protein [Actinomadura sp. NBRC 104412]GLZ02708.1 ABC transporter ATP-binding protein [Actinomadura sp. NBRC 104412]
MLEIRDLDAFYGAAQALWGVSLEVGDGEIVGIIGPNGAGKTTLVHAIARLHTSTRGRVVVNGTDLATVPPHRVCEHGVAIVPEGRRVFPHLTTEENLFLGAYRKTARARHREHLASVYDLFPRLAERSGQQAGSLSGGEQQMLAIGRALMAGPRLLLLDEPSLGLAPVVVDEVFDAIEAINGEGVSILLVEQDVDRALTLAARGYLLIEGRVLAEGPSDRLRESQDVQRNVLGI